MVGQTAQAEVAGRETSVQRPAVTGAAAMAAMQAATQVRAEQVVCRVRNRAAVEHIQREAVTANSMLPTLSALSNAQPRHRTPVAAIHSQPSFGLRTRQAVSILPPPTAISIR